MDIMVKQRKLSNLKTIGKFEKWILLILLSVNNITVANAKIFDATVKPSISISQIYSDNLNYGYDQSGLKAGTPHKQEGFVTQLSPGISIARKGPHSEFNMNYRLQSLFYQDINLNTQLFNQLQMTSHTELFRNSLYLDTSSTISQSNLSSIGGFSPDNISRTYNQGYTTYRNFRISPYWIIHYDGYVDGEARFTYFNFGNSGTSGVNTNQIIGNGNLNSNSYQQSINLRNGKKLSIFGWRLSLNNQDQHNEGASSEIFSNSSIKFRSANGEVSYRLGIYDLNAFIQTGYYDNSYPSNLSTNNGFYLTPGISWTPSQKFQIAVGYGYNANFTNLTWKPSQRTSLQFSYRSSNVGGSNTGGTYGFGGLATGSGLVGTGFDMNSNSASGGALGAAVAGDAFNGMFQHRTRTTLLNASYTTTISTIQQYLSNQSTFTTPTDLSGNPIGQTTANNRDISLPNLNNDVFTSKNARLSLTWSLRKSNITISVYKNNISYALNVNRPQDIYGVSASMIWHFSQRMSATFQGTWQNSQYNNSNITTIGNNKTEYYSASLMVIRQISPSISGYLQYSYYQFNNGSSNNSLNSGTFDQNRVTASVNIIF